MNISSRLTSIIVLFLVTCFTEQSSHGSGNEEKEFDEISTSSTGRSMSRSRYVTPGRRSRSLPELSRSRMDSDTFSEENVQCDDGQYPPLTRRLISHLSLTCRPRSRSLPPLTRSRLYSDAPSEENVQNPNSRSRLRSRSQSLPSICDTTFTHDSLSPGRHMLPSWNPTSRRRFRSMPSLSRSQIHSGAPSQTFDQNLQSERRISGSRIQSLTRSTSLPERRFFPSSSRSQSRSRSLPALSRSVTNYGRSSIEHSLGQGSMQPKRHMPRSTSPSRSRSRSRSPPSKEFKQETQSVPPQEPLEGDHQEEDLQTPTPIDESETATRDSSLSSPCAAPPKTTNYPNGMTTKTYDRSNDYISAPDDGSQPITLENLNDAPSLDPEVACRLYITIVDGGEQREPVHQVFAQLPFTDSAGAQQQALINILNDGRGKFILPFKNPAQNGAWIIFITNSGYTYLPYKEPNSNDYYWMQTQITPSQAYYKQETEEHFFARYGYKVMPRSSSMNPNKIPQIERASRGALSAPKVAPDSYIFAVFWAPSICLIKALQGKWVEEETCSQARFTIHGLWEYSRNLGIQNQMDGLREDDRIANSMKFIDHARVASMSYDLLRHWNHGSKGETLHFFKREYIVHGQFFHRNEEAYAKKAIEIFRHTGLSEYSGPMYHYSDDVVVSHMASDIRSRFRKFTTDKSFTIKCTKLNHKQSLLNELRFCFDSNGNARDCPKGQWAKWDPECAKDMLVPRSYQLAPYVYLSLTYRPGVEYYKSGKSKPMMKAAIDESGNPRMFVVDKLCPAMRYEKLVTNQRNDRTVLGDSILDELTKYTETWSDDDTARLNEIWPPVSGDQSPQHWMSALKECATSLYDMKKLKINSPADYMQKIEQLYKELNAESWNLQTSGTRDQKDVSKELPVKGQRVVFMCHPSGSKVLLKIHVCFDLNWLRMPCPETDDFLAVAKSSTNQREPSYMATLAAKECGKNPFTVVTYSSAP